jgi:hypothetical protein
MAGEPSQPRRSRPVGGTPSDPPTEPTLPGVGPSMAPITANTPLPPLTPLPLASQSGGGSAAPQPPPEPFPAPIDQPALPPLPPNNPVQQAQPGSGRAAGSGVSSTWAAYTLFAVSFTSLILIVAMAIAAAVISKSANVLIWMIVLIFLFNIGYAVVVFNIARPDPTQPIRLPFITPRRGQ